MDRWTDGRALLCYERSEEKSFFFPTYLVFRECRTLTFSIDSVQRAPSARPLDIRQQRPPSSVIFS